MDVDLVSGYQKSEDTALSLIYCRDQDNQRIGCAPGVFEG